jgi:hypothetical protein
MSSMAKKMKVSWVVQNEPFDGSGEPLWTQGSFGGTKALLPRVGEVRVPAGQPNQLELGEFRSHPSPKFGLRSRKLC